MKSMCQEARRNSPSVADWSPTFLCIRTTSRIASSSTARSRSAETCPAAKPSRASRSSGGRSRLPTWSARNGGLSRGMLVQAQQLACVALVDPLALGARDVERVDVRDRVADERALHRVEGHVAREEHVLGAEELVRATQRVRRTEDGGVGVEAPEGLDRAFVERAVHKLPLLLRRALPEAVHAGTDAPGEEGDHAARVVRDDLEIRMADEDAGEDEPGHEDRRVVWPPEEPPDLVLRLPLVGVVGPGRVARRMHPNRPVELGHAGEQRLEAGIVEWQAVHVRVDLDAEGAELPHGPVDLPERGVHVVHRQTGDEADERLRARAHQLGHLVVRQAGEVGRLGRLAQRLERRRRQADDLRVVVEGLDHAQPLVDVPERADRGGALHEVRGPLARALLEPVEVPLRQYVAERIELHGRLYSTTASEVSGFSSTTP